MTRVAHVRRRASDARLRARRLRHGAARALRRAPVVLTYHRVAEERFDPWGLCVSPRDFAGQLDAIAASGRPVLRLTDLCHALRAGTLPRHAVVVTFDDGYLDNLRHAAPALAARGMPATVFVTTEGLARTGSTWWDELADIVASAAGARTVLELDRPVEVVLPEDAPPPSPAWRAEEAVPPGPREELYLDLWHRLLPVAPARRRHALDELRAALHARVPSPTRMLDVAALRALAASPGISIGAHTVTHASLPALDASAREWEARESKRVLEELLGHPIELFAYPFGHHDEASVAAVRRAGFTAAVTTDGRHVSRQTDPFRIPRFSVPPIAAAAFDAHLAGLG